MRPWKLVLAGKCWIVRGVVGVVAAAQVQEPTVVLDELALLSDLHVQRPTRVFAAPGRAHHAVPKADLLVDAKRPRRLADVIEDRRPVGDGLGFLPRTEGIAQGEHVRVRADARIAEQIPSAANGVARLEDCVALLRTLGLQPVPRADAGKARADHDHVEIRRAHPAPSKRAKSLVTIRSCAPAMPAYHAGTNHQDRSTSSS